MPRLPPVDISPHVRLRATFWPGVGYSVVTFDQSHSSSSATSWARPVRVPWPISDRAMRTTTVSSGLITTQALTSPVLSAVASSPNGRWNPIDRPPSAAAELARNERRLIFGMKFMIPSSRARGHVDRLAHLLIGAATANVGNGGVDVRVGRLRLLLEERRDRHDHAALAVAALRHVVRDPGLLHRMQLAAGRQDFD